MQPTKLTENLQMSPLVLGLWRLIDWSIPASEVQAYVEEALSMGITTFDHADIYGDYGCEAEFGKVLKNQPHLRDQMQLVTKCGIMLRSQKFPDRKVKHYDTSYAHIMQSVEQSLQNLHTDYVDLLLIHRPDPLMDPAETARAFDELKQAGKVRHFGVSNFTPMQYQMLDAYMGGRLITNQVELSPYRLEHFENGNMDFFLKERIRPMAWSPLAGGNLLQPQDERGVRLKLKLEAIARETGVDGIDKLAIAWILKHPSRPIPIVGTGNIEHLKRSVDALSVELSREQWFQILEAAMGHEVA
ncbi:putative aldo-keto reductase YcsN [Flammeovirgaceae bacterium 311]|nr:putative aldo-keto reductase YcsN [Flammeovirgaceae bacterium 311]